MMADLPPERVQPCLPFLHTSVDMFGPTEIRISFRKTAKRYGIIFTCLSSRAVHIVVCEDASTAAFLNALRAFIAIRGTPASIYSDNGTNFVGAERELRPVLEKVSTDVEWKEELIKRGIKWKRYTPLAPHFGGVHEALIRSAKRAIHHVLDASHKRRLLSECELHSLYAEVTAFLNNRPLTFVSSDPKDGYLTPNHLLMQRTTGETPPGILSSTPFHDTYEHVQYLANEVWKQWTREYLPALTTRAKWQACQRNAQVGDLVLLVEENLPRDKWITARVTEVFKGNRGFVRSVRLLLPTLDFTKKKYLSRPIVKCCLLDAADQLSIAPWGLKCSD